jgi:hypothetical protein
MTLPSCPVLTMIDARNGAGQTSPALRERPDALALELRARALAEAYWSEHVWLTGRLSDAAFRAVYEALLAEIEPDERKRCLAILRRDRLKVLQLVPHQAGSGRIAS